MKKYIHVNQHVIRHNKKYGGSIPACRVQTGSSSKYCQEVIINGPSKMVYRPNKPLKCGATLWIETNSDLELVNEVAYKSISGKLKEITGK